MDITHLGHSCVLLEVADQRILVDPGNFSDIADVRDLTAVLVTHQHPDHVDPAQLAGLLDRSPDARVLLEPESVGQLAEAAGEHRDRLESMPSGTDIELGPVTVSPVGHRHAFIHDFVPRIDNVGLVIRADGEPTLFHPGDALDAEPGPVDVLLVPVSAPWARVGDTVTFVRRIAPTRAIPIHDGLLNDTGREMYLRHISSFGADGGLEVLDLREQGRTRL
ncbi:MBL fold metallo-hydrolase [Ornithinimicrobium cryptoxanthini]|uniref:MBL fold metallo-hydrolase n=1 Tax=Ornithinimicrobium cryptoxanthini TaxID=2934161 RepID=A0ABY4YE74_9MICO|nr:MBL fold metallo-hydrolase [Ornithinimicrobium cryptoxanthini]USQ75038.1 MBL fold metallo-hydrolase [Ornithinimicrobium cryptoxanthini]